jgi:hypothetical protein
MSIAFVLDGGIVLKLELLAEMLLRRGDGAAKIS